MSKIRQELDQLHLLSQQADNLRYQDNQEQIYEELRAIIRNLKPAQQAFLLTAQSADSDNDGLNNTLEGYWCTDPNRADTDFDGTNDGDEVAALKAWMNNELSKAPSTGKPFQGWPHQKTNCYDDDSDSVPDIVERLELGLNANRESTDRDKFDDGQELFGSTYCSGSGGFCGYGALPRNEDWGLIFAEMPSWVKPPGNHPLVAAFPVPEIDVVESSFRVQAVTTITTDRTITEGTERSYSTSKTEGTSTSVANTINWNEWEEVAESLQQRLIKSQAFDGLSPAATSITAGFWNKAGKFTLGTLKVVGGLGTGLVGCAAGLPAAATIVGTIPGLAVCGASVAGGIASIVDGFSDIGDAFSPDNAQQVAPPNQYQSVDVRLENQVDVNNQVNVVLNQSFDTSSIVRALEGTRYAYLQTGELISQRLYEIGHFLAAPVRTTTTTKGRSWGGAQTTTTEQYEEHTITNGEAFSSSESWGTATAVDSAHAADLWFTYKVRNTGAEYAREIGNLAFNIYIGDDPNPVCTYYVGSATCGQPVDTVLFANFMPDEEHTYTSARIPLTLEQMKAIDLGGPIRIVVEDFTYGIDELFYQDAVNAGVLIAIEDGTDDGDEAIDTYLIPTWGSETVLDVLARYFPHETDADGNLIAIWTPEYNRSDTPAWCVEPRRLGTTLWCKHALSTADWWNIYTDGLGDGSQGFQDTPAAPGSVVLFRFNKDTDLDGYSDRSERRLGTDPNDPADYPKPELIAGVHSIRSGNRVTATLSLLNTGLYDAYGVEAVMIAPDDSVSITNNTVGGSGRVRAQKQVIVGSRIKLQSPLPDPWTQPGHAVPAAAGYYTGQRDRTYTFTVQCGDPTGCDVGAGSWTLAWDDGAGNNGTLNFGAGYASPTFLDVGTLGVQLALYTGKVYDGESFTVEARTPRDTFQYTINREPYTEPIIIVSYNDPQGNHKFITPVRLSSPTEDLVLHSGKMIRGGAGVEIVTGGPFTAGQPMETKLLVQAPARMVDAHLFLEFIDPQRHGGAGGGDHGDAGAGAECGLHPLELQ
ncbi:MAG: thrombospondin type 3 repeat-containing protein [Ardenticatenia bacterium]|nr:thrombospondin type 3 repeat-containing protein [Ardenticatenia bacterium]